MQSPKLLDLLHLDTRVPAQEFVRYPCAFSNKKMYSVKSSKLFQLSRLQWLEGQTELTWQEKRCFVGAPKITEERLQRHWCCIEMHSSHDPGSARSPGQSGGRQFVMPVMPSFLWVQGDGLKTKVRRRSLNWQGPHRQLEQFAHLPNFWA